jgi:DNA-binding IclR family transcriptional regulator
MPASDLENQRSIQSIEIGGRLLNALALQSGPMSLKELAQAADMTPSKAHPYLVSFSRLGLIEQERDSGQYRLGPAALQLGLSCLRQLDPLKIAGPLMEELSERIQQSVVIAVWGNLGPTVVRMIESHQPIHVNMRVGTVMSVNRTATGKIFAAFMPEQKLEALKGIALGDRMLRDQKIIDVRLPSQELVRIKRTAMAQAIGQPIPGIHALSAAVFDQFGALALAITALGPAESFDVALDGPIAQALRDTADQISHRLGQPRDRSAA